jgi:hypothetical protein
MVQTLRPLTIGELLDRTFLFYRRHFVLFVGIAALPSVLLLAFQLTTVYFRRTASGPLVLVVFSLAWIVVYIVTSTLAHGATVIAVSQVLLGKDAHVAEAFQSIRPRVGRLILINLNFGLRVMLGLLLLIVPGILLGLRYSLTIPVAVLEDTGVSDSLSRSAALTKGHRGRILLIYFLLVVLATIASMLWPVLTVLVAAIVYSGGVASGPVWLEVMGEFGNFVSQSLVTPVMTIALTLVYYDERVRKEAFDLEHMMQLLDGAVLPAPPPA